MDADALLTLVIPAYNVERFIGACLESVIGQCKRYSVPIVVVIDGATDQTEVEAHRVLAAYNFRQTQIIVQENRGLSGARNRGLDAVGTEYVTFLDSDDLWSSNYLNCVMPILRQRRPDILEYDATMIAEDGSTIRTFKITPVMDGTLAAITLADFLTVFRCYAWARVTRTEILRRHPFPVGERFEDAGSVPWHYWSAYRIDSVGETLIRYRQHNNSILASPKLQDVYDLAKTVRRASAEYAQTRASYWQTVANRIHQVACGRVLFLPLAAWPACVDALNEAIAGTPPNPGLLRWLQLRQPYVYLLLLLVKRRITTAYRWLTPARRP